jgi:hypothetical protein
MLLPRGLFILGWFHIDLIQDSSLLMYQKLLDLGSAYIDGSVAVVEHPP